MLPCDSDGHDDTSGKELDGDIAGELSGGLSSKLSMHLLSVGDCNGEEVSIQSSSSLLQY